MMLSLLLLIPFLGAFALLFWPTNPPPCPRTMRPVLTTESMAPKFSPAIPPVRAPVTLPAKAALVMLPAAALIPTIPPALFTKMAKTTGLTAAFTVAVVATS
jgi:hypothetical protein